MSKPIRACEWEVGRYDPPLRIVERWQRDGTRMFSVSRGGYVFWRRWNRGRSVWVLEPIPSDRDQAFIEAFRYREFEDAAWAAESAGCNNEWEFRFTQIDMATFENARPTSA